MNNLNICYITYQNFPAQTANSYQSISNICSFVDNKHNVTLVFPLRDKNSSKDIKILQDFYNFEEVFNIIGLKHNLPFGKFTFFSKLFFYFSHFIWTLYAIKKIDINNFDFYFTRSDWAYYFLSRKNKNVIFEIHQVSKTRKLVLWLCRKKKNSKVIYLNENLQRDLNQFTKSNKSMVLHNGVKIQNFKHVIKKKEIVFVGSLSRFGYSRNINFLIDGFINSSLNSDYIFKIIGGPNEVAESLKIQYQDFENIHILGYKNPNEVVPLLKTAEIGVLINSPNHKHSTTYTSPLKYFEYLAYGLKILAIDFESHKVLPFSEDINFFEADNKKSLINAIEAAKIKKVKVKDLALISLDHRVKKIIELNYYNV